jgi:hypothetical protein
MGFLSGRVSFSRYRVTGRSPKAFGPEHLERLTAHTIGKQRVASADGTEVGWGGGAHILDKRFDLEKNIVNDALHFTLRVDAQKPPADLLRAYTAIELQARKPDSANGRPSLRQRREARQAARERLETEGRDGRFLRRRSYPLLWDAASNELLVGPMPGPTLAHLNGLFQTTFERQLEATFAGRRAFLLAEARGQTRGIEDAKPTEFVPGLGTGAAEWVKDEASQDFLGNEFLLWLWFVLDAESDTVALADQSQAAIMVAQSLVLECPRGQTGKQILRSDGPARLPEARQALRSGKLPRRMGLILERQGRQYELTLDAESLAISGAKLPQPEADDERAVLDERVECLRHLVQTLDLIYDAFGERRFGAGWRKEATRMREWLQKNRKQSAAVG